jgi:hypothetical protein
MTELADRTETAFADIADFLEDFGGVDGFIEAPVEFGVNRNDGLDFESPRDFETSLHLTRRPLEID